MHVLDLALQHLSVLVHKQLHVVLRVVRNFLDVVQVVVLHCRELIKEVVDLLLNLLNSLFSLSSILNLHRHLTLQLVLSDVCLIL
jgi:hypothetical protein